LFGDLIEETIWSVQKFFRGLPAGIN